MPWVRIDENAIDHPKVLLLSDGAFRLWVESLAHCQRFLTDGVIGNASLRGLRNYSQKRRECIVSAGLWDETPHGIHIHDYLQWNDTREQVLHARESGKRRTLLLRDSDLRQQIRDRDGDHCRYCWQVVRWNDRKSPLGATYDHVDPLKGNLLENLVVSCRSCNCRKGKRTPEEAQMPLLPPRSKSDLDQIKPATSGGVGGFSSGSSVKERGSGETTLAKRAEDFTRWYETKHEQLFGVAYMGTNMDWVKLLQLVDKFSDQQLRDAALVWFGDDDDFASRGTRTIAKFASRVSGYLQLIKAKGIA